jgi:predicted metalloprotease
MQLGDQRASGNVEDRRGMGIGVGGGLGIGGVVIAIIAAFLGFDPGQVLNTVQQVQQAAPGDTREAPRGTPADATGQFVSKVLGSTEDVWGEIFKQNGSTYKPPTLVLYNGQVRSACGTGQAAMGPFYCPNDQKLYLDLSFFEDLQRRFRAPGDFAQAYVIAHEVGHHVQNLTGGFAKRESMRGRGSQSEANRGSVQLELQADCYAGVWGHYAARNNQLDPGDVDEALGAATAIGDDRLQKQSQGVIVPESFTHGSSAQRVRWFKRGMESGSPKSCDTFSAGSL